MSHVTSRRTGGQSYFCILEVWPSYTKRHSQVVMSHFLMVESAPPVITKVSCTATQLM